ncbi:MAG: hypothetical protein A2V63_08390 [Candidatus Eisenbacteria bacterium RBG_19FT_COMBO_70_11]|nr:MAG: hypothetical protein A2V63_08390 [Candidatus Eisenbacteria bacterium RBG_19FT_COMBO_70_11]
MATRQKPKRTVRRSVKKAAAKHPRRRAASKPRAAASAPRRKFVDRRQPETLRLRSMTPTFTVNDLEESIAWYRDGLGFVVSERWEEGGKLQGVMLKAGSCAFALSQDDFRKGRDREKGVGFRILADTSQSVDALAERIRAYGGKIIMEPADMPWGARSFAVEDPDGFKVSFNEPR